MNDSRACDSLRQADPVRGGRTWHRTCSAAGMASVERMLVWRLADELRHQAQDLARRPQVRRDFRFAGQFMDCAASVGRNIAEGFGRIGPREFTRFLIIARGSVSELQDHLADGVTRRYWTSEEIKAIRLQCRRIQAAIDSLIGYLRTPDAEERAGGVIPRRPPSKH